MHIKKWNDLDRSEDIFSKWLKIAVLDMLTTCKCLWDSKMRHWRISILFEMNFVMGQKSTVREKIFKVTTLRKQDFLLVHSFKQIFFDGLIYLMFSLVWKRIFSITFFVLHKLNACFLRNFSRSKTCKIKDFSFRFWCQKNKLF